MYGDIIPSFLASVAATRAASTETQNMPTYPTMQSKIYRYTRFPFGMWFNLKSRGCRKLKRREHSCSFVWYMW